MSPFHISILMLVGMFLTIFTTQTFAVSGSTTEQPQPLANSIEPSGSGGGGISGTVRDSSGHGISDVTMTLSGQSSAVTTTDSQGGYFFTGLGPGQYTVTPSKSGYTFNPSSQNPFLTPDEIETGVDFTGTPDTYSVSGRVTEANGTGVANVTITLNTGQMAITDVSGNYMIGGLSSGSYTLTPSKEGVTFTPASLSVSVPPDRTDQNFTAVPNSISGQVTDDTGMAMIGVTISTNTGQTATTDGSGNYSFNELPAGTYTLTPRRSGYVFDPTTREVTVPPSAINQNFTARLIPKLSFREAAHHQEMLQAGSTLIIKGEDFPANRQVTITVNGNNSLGRGITTDANGEFEFLLQTDQAEVGGYSIKAGVDLTASIFFRLYETGTLAQDEDASLPILSLPPDIAFTEFLYLPVIMN